MKSSAKNIGLFLFVIFLIITIPLIYSLYNLQSQLAIDLEIPETLLRQKTDATILRLIGFFVIELLIAGAGVFFILRQRDNNDFYDLESILQLDNNTPHNSNSKFSTEPLTGQEKRNITKHDFSKLITNVSKDTTSVQYLNYVTKHISNTLDLAQAVFYIATKDEDEKTNILEAMGGYAYYKQEKGHVKYAFGEGLAGQVAKAQKLIYVKDVPDGYIEIISGLGKSTPSYLLILPLVHKGNTIAVIELASFHEFNTADQESLVEISEKLAAKVNSKIKNDSKESETDK